MVEVLAASCTQMDETAPADMMPCKACGRPISEAHAADDYDAGAPFWDHCATCADTLLDRPAPPDAFGGTVFSAN